jgi:hypothetical protein
MSVDEMSVDKMSVDEMSVDKMSVDVMICYLYTTVSILQCLIISMADRILGLFA